MNIIRCVRETRFLAIAGFLPLLVIVEGALAFDVPSYENTRRAGWDHSSNQQLKTATSTPITALLNCGDSLSGNDRDDDGIVDNCEQQLAEKFAPIVYHSSDESNYPTAVDLFLRNTSIWFYDDDCNPDLRTKLVSTPTQSQLLAQFHQGGCGATDTIFSNGTRSFEKHRTFFLEDVSAEFRVGSLDSKNWVTYYHAYRNELDGITIQYWRFYAFNDAFNDHGGDWEGLHIVLNKDLKPQRVGLLGHEAIDFQPFSSLQAEGFHVRVYSEGGGHATRTSGNAIEAQGCSGPVACVISLDNPRTFVRQETWTDGEVKWFNGTVGRTGSLLNVGEKMKPMNDQIFIQYSGIWGSPGAFFGTSGFWGPAFNETGMRSDGFITAWCSGMVGERVKQECFATAKSR